LFRIFNLLGQKSIDHHKKENTAKYQLEDIRILQEALTMEDEAQAWVSVHQARDNLTLRDQQLVLQ
jgi:hypothetical protein